MWKRRDSVDSQKAAEDERFTTLQSRMDAKFDELAQHLTGFHGQMGHITKMLQQVQDQMGRLEATQRSLSSSLVAHGSLSQRGPASNRDGGGSVRGGSKDLVAAAQLRTPSNKMGKTASIGHSELVPLLSSEDLNGKDGTGNFTTEDLQKMTFQEKLAMAQESMQAGKQMQSPLVKMVTAFLEDPESGKAATMYAKGILWFNVFAIGLGLLPFADIRLPAACAEAVDFFIDSFLFAEVVVRAIFCPNPQYFLADFSNVIDLMSGLPLLTILLMHMGMGDSFNAVGWLFLLCAVPIIRCLRLIRRFPKMQILVTAFTNVLEALPVLLYTMAMMACIFTSLLYAVEPRDNITTLSEAGWMVLSTMSTVGYGDVTPVTRFGHGLTSVLMVVSPLYMAMPFGIIGASFTQIWAGRNQILLLQGTRDRLAKWGFGAYEIPRLFALFDLDDSAEIDLNEFILLLKEMEIGFREDDIIELFKTIDKDSGGTIDEKEFVKTLYPQEYRYMYGKRKLTEFALSGDATSSMAMFDHA